MTITQSYYVAVGEERRGPFEEEEIRRQYLSGQLAPFSPVWAEGMTDWIPLAQVFNLSELPPPEPLPVIERPPWEAKRTHYVMWPVVTTVIFGALWGLTLMSLKNVENEARHYVAEIQRMNSGGYLLDTAAESFVRGAMGDPLGKAFEEISKASFLDEKLKTLHEEYSSDQQTAHRLFVGMVLFGSFAIWKHLRWKKTAVRPAV